MLRGLGIAIIPASAPDFFTEDTPTAVLVRQVLGAIAQFEKARQRMAQRPSSWSRPIGSLATSLCSSLATTYK